MLYKNRTSDKFHFGTSSHYEYTGRQWPVSICLPVLLCRKCILYGVWVQSVSFLTTVAPLAVVAFSTATPR